MRKVIPGPVYRVVSVAVGIATAVLALYWAFAGRGIYPAVARAMDSPYIGFLVSWLVLLAPAVPVLLGLRMLAKVPPLREELRQKWQRFAAGAR